MEKFKVLGNTEGLLHQPYMAIILGRAFHDDLQIISIFSIDRNNT